MGFDPAKGRVRTQVLGEWVQLDCSKEMELFGRMTDIRTDAKIGIKQTEDRCRKRLVRWYGM